MGSETLKDTQSKLELRTADGRVALSHLLAVELPLITVAVPGDSQLDLVKGSRLGVSLPEGKPKGNAAPQGPDPGDLPVTAHGMCPGSGGATIVSLEVENRAEMTLLGIGDLRTMLNERESFRSPVFPGSLVSSAISASGSDGRPKGSPAEVLVMDVSFDGLGLLVGEGALEAVKTAPFVHVALVTPKGLPIEVVGAVRHVARMSGGARLGIAAGIVGARWPEAQEQRLRQFVVAQQRLGIDRKRGD